jgi:hypothetical protein
VTADYGTQSLLALCAEAVRDEREHVRALAEALTVAVATECPYCVDGYTTRDGRLEGCSVCTRSSRNPHPILLDGAHTGRIQQAAWRWREKHWYSIIGVVPSFRAMLLAYADLMQSHDDEPASPQAETLLRAVMEAK